MPERQVDTLHARPVHGLPVACRCGFGSDRCRVHFLKEILHNAEHMRDSVLSMRERVRILRRRSAAKPGVRRKLAAGKGKRGSKGSNAST